jgi:5-methylcytosine-specific restriction endonuclease McrA
MTHEVAKKKWNGSRWIRPEKRLAIYLRDEFLCCYCGTDLHDARPEDINLDHIQPRVHGGGNEETNLITSCKTCNCKRGAKSCKEYATAGAWERIKRFRRRDLKRYVVMAKALIADKTGSECEELR